MFVARKFVSVLIDRKNINGKQQQMHAIYASIITTP